MKDVRVEIVSPDELDEPTRRGMFDVMCRNYGGVAFEQFGHDLDAKQFVMIGYYRDQPGGFTTGRCFEHQWGEFSATILFSGDTIIDEPYRGNPVWAMMWLRHAMEIADACDGPCWWMLTTKGQLTYRFLPVWFKEFYPRCDEATPSDVVALLDSLGQAYGGARYGAERNVVRHPDGQHLRDGVGAPSDRSERNAHVVFFLERNPGWQRGDELVCLAPLAWDNLRGRLADRIAREETE
jgi:hypothetical protein